MWDSKSPATIQDLLSMAPAAQSMRQYISSNSHVSIITAADHQEQNCSLPKRSSNTPTSLTHRTPRWHGTAQSTKARTANSMRLITGESFATRTRNVTNLQTLSVSMNEPRPYTDRHIRHRPDAVTMEPKHVPSQTTQSTLKTIIVTA